MEKLNYNRAAFLLSAATLEQLPLDEGAEVAFIGRSNAGKSSAINTITGIKGLARISKMPGRTQLINFFTLDNEHRFVDLPGYGYAKVPLAIKKRWEETVNHYLQQRHCLRGLVLVMDIRHPLKRLDLQLIEWSAKCDLPVHILLTKVDKLKPSQALTTLQKVQQAVSLYTQTTVQCFSSLTQAGLDEAVAQLNNWLTEDSLHAAK